MSGRAWTEAEDDTLRARYPGLARVAPLLALLPGRSANAIAMRAKQLGLRSARAWSRRELVTLRDGWHEYSARGLRARLRGRTWYAIYWKARAIGLPLGVPQGCESLQACADRVGFDRKSLARVLAEQGVQVRQHYPKPGMGRQHSYHRQYVETDAANEAVVRHLDTETVEAAALARGMHGNTLRGILRRAGLAPKQGAGIPLRVPSKAIDAALEAWRGARKEAA